MMTSKLTMEFDFDKNSPFIRGTFDNVSKDVRDQLFRRFVELFGYESSWAKIRLEGAFEDSTFTIYPIAPDKLSQESKILNEQVRLQEKINE